MRLGSFVTASLLAVAWSPPGDAAADLEAASRAAERKRCPASCTSAGTNSSQWFAYQTPSRLNACNETMLLDFSLLDQLDNAHKSSKITACTAVWNSVSDSESTAKTATCQPHGVNNTKMTGFLKMVSSGSSAPAHLSDVVDSLQQLERFFESVGTGCNEMIQFSYSGKSAVGVYVGSRLASQGTITSVLNKLSTALQSEGSVPESVAIQLCNHLSARYSLGVYISTNADLSETQKAVQTWKNGSCLADSTTSAWHDIDFLHPAIRASNNSRSNSTAKASSGNKLSSSGTCTTVQVVSGDSCTSLAAECGITPAEFTEYNPAANECSTLAVGEYVCCSPGSLPDRAPKPDANGNCYAYTVKSGDTCDALAAAYTIKADDITTWNADTWGWTGCGDLLIGYLICLSDGYPPMPAPIANAVCGPQVPDTPTASHGANLSTLNECPLNACCDIWGQCGTTAEFCTISESATGAPGTAAPGQNGCISNCGTHIVTSAAPSSHYTIGYFEGFDWSRSCLNGGVQNLNTSSYTHVHFAFITFNSDWSLNTTDVDPKLPLFFDLQGVKKIISIGGWAFSTDPIPYALFRDVVATPASRAALINNIVNYLNDHDLDGVDLDWEYPDEPDIPGIPAGTEADVTGFFLLLDELKESIASKAPGKTISITAPASYCTVVDYMVFMTYDLHGQWDYGNAFSDPACPGGNCLRSHVNLAETINSLSMITKAGAPSNMIAVGVTSYARSFEMTTPGCWTEMCTYVGPNSGARPGPCTGTAGYISNYELDLVIAQDSTAQQYWDADSWSNIIVYDQVQWGAYMNDTNKAAGKAIYEGLGFLGSSDWAMDLQDDFGDTSELDGPDTIYINPDIWKSETPVVTASPGVTLIWPPMPLETPTTIMFPPWTTTMSYSTLTTLTTTLSDGSTSVYPWYYYVPIPTVINIPPLTTTEIPVWGVYLNSSATEGTILLTSSVQPLPIVVTFRLTAFCLVPTRVLNGTTSIIGASATSTVSGGAVIWQGKTDILPPATETLGGRTTIIGGITLPPHTTTLTPNPHPTTTQTKPDPEINPKTIPWTSGHSPSPTSPPGCPGCGRPCLLFYDPDCPFCPPGAFGNPNGNGDGDDDDTTSASTSTSEAASATVFAAEDLGDAFPDLASDSALFADLIAYEIEIFNIEGWATDGGAELKKQESGCGALTFWTWHDATDDKAAYVYFDLPTLIKAGCVERAIMSAGGPKLSCQGKGVTFDIDKVSGGDEDSLAPAVPALTQEKLDELVKVYGNHSDTAQAYVPMD
ncbi:class V chitinase Chi100 [Dactylonectria macrodidyma]|uniref:chitinase n=1 Tax=Dactylonectria macrodidyma TaxID=307937 RepID=A0A9P9DLF0_9HYPO|nr:class V chitinase Chi100 [Dactylonectria macrodidyma]